MNLRGKEYYRLRWNENGKRRERNIRLPDDVNSAEYEKAYLAIREGKSDDLHRRRSTRVDRGIIDCLEGCVKSARKRAARRGMEFSITNEIVVALWHKQNRVCAITALPFTPQSKNKTTMREPWRPSIDRIDQEQGYTPDNIRIISVIANLGRNEFSDEDFLKMCKAVWENAT
jgi:hypothetical protein